MRRRVMGGFVVAVAAITIAGCSTPLVPGVGLVGPINGSISPGVSEGLLWIPPDFNPLELLIPARIKTMVGCSLTGGPITVELTSYSDPGGVGSDIVATAHRTTGLNGPIAETYGSYTFTSVGDVASSPVLTSGDCFRLDVSSEPVCVERPPPPLEGPNLNFYCTKVVWSGATFTVDW